MNEGMPGENREELARRYYQALDRENYSELQRLLSQDFTQYRPDRTLERTRFLEFMRSERPIEDTSHEIHGVYHGPDGVAVVGRVTEDGDRLFGYVDVFSFDEEATQITEVTTYSR